MKLTDTYFSRYFFYKLAKHKSLLIVSLIANVLALPLMSLIMSSSVSMLYNMTAGTDSNQFIDSIKLTELASYAENAFVVCAGIFLIITIISLITPSIVMSYNNNQSDTDMYLSLPITARSRFLADSLVGAIISVLPLAVNFLGGFIFIQKAADIIKSDSEYLMYMERYLSGIQEITVCNSYELFCLAATTGIITVTACYFTSLFFSCCTGRKAEGVIYSILTPILILLTTNNTISIILSTTPGVRSWQEIESIPAHISPFGTLLAGMNAFSRSLTVSAEMVAGALALPITVIFSAVVICLLLFFAAYLCTVKRKAENTGKPFAIELVYKIIMTLLVVCFTSILMTAFWNNQAGLVITIIILLAVYMAIQLFHYKSIKKLPRLILHFALTSAIAFGCFILIGFSRGLGYGNYIPDAEQVESVSVGESITGYFSINSLSYTDKKDIEVITSLHKACIDNNAETGHYFRIIYKMKDGKIVTRDYIDETSRNINTIKQIRQELLSCNGMMEQVFAGDNISNHEGSFVLKDRFVSSALSEEGVKKLMQAIKQDSLSGAFRCEAIMGHASIHWLKSADDYKSIELSVTEDCKNMLAVLTDENNYTYAGYGQYYATYEEANKPDSIFMILEKAQHLNYGETEYFYIRNKDMENEKVKELTALVEFPYESYSDDWAHFVSICNVNLYMRISAENAEKADKLIKEIEAERENNNDNVNFDGFIHFNN